MTCIVRYISVLQRCDYIPITVQRQQIDVLIWVGHTHIVGSKHELLNKRRRSTQNHNCSSNSKNAAIVRKGTTAVRGIYYILKAATIHYYLHVPIGMLGIYRLLFLPAGQPPVLKLLRGPILQFFAPQGRHYSRINVKCGTAVPSAVPNFTLLGGILGDFRPQNTKICQRISEVANFYHTGANPAPDFSEIYELYARSLSTQRIKIWCNLVHK